MKYNNLGKTGIKVSNICFGSLTIGPLQRNFTPFKGGKIIKHAIDSGINFIDTAELYETYEHIREGTKHISRNDYVVSTKSYAYDYNTAKKSVDDALRLLDTDYIDIFLLHEQESEHTIRGHYEALEYYLKLKEKGIIRAVGLSTHAIAGVKAANKYKEIDVIHPILNMSGLGITDGSVIDMLEEVSKFHNSGRGVFSMKPLGGGNLINKYDESLDFILSQTCIDSIAIGMQSIDEVSANILRFSNKSIDKKLQSKLNNQKRSLHIADWCTKCSKCIEKCSHHALSLKDGKVFIDSDKCVLCGYCAAVCDDFCIKVI